MIEEQKFCSKCKETKALEEFSRRGPDKRQAHCKPCARLKQIEWRKANVEKIRIAHRLYYLENIDRARAYYQTNKVELKEKHATYRKENIDKIKVTSKLYYENNIQQAKDSALLRYEEYRLRHIELVIKWQKRNPEKVKGYQKAYIQRLKKKDDNYMLKNRERARVYYKNNREKVLARMQAKKDEKLK